VCWELTVPDIVICTKSYFEAVTISNGSMAPKLFSALLSPGIPIEAVLVTPGEV
jgi:hypothetical protein